MKFVIARANEKLAHIAGLELVLDKSADDEEDEVDASQAAQSQPATQGSKASAAQAKYLLVNKLQGGVSSPPSDAHTIYLGFVETVLQLVARNQGACMAEEVLLTDWLPKLGLARDHHLPHHTQKAEELIGKRMVAEGFLKRRKTGTGANEFVIGGRALLTRNAEAANHFHEATIINRTEDA